MCKDKLYFLYRNARDAYLQTFVSKLTATGIALCLCSLLSASAHSQGRECALAGPRVRSREAESAESWNASAVACFKEGAGMKLKGMMMPSVGIDLF